TINRKKPKDVPVNAFKVNKYALLESEKINKATSMRQIDRWLLLIFVVNVAGINITNEGFYLENKDPLEEISFPEDIHIKQRYRLMELPFVMVIIILLIFVLKMSKMRAGINMIVWEKPIVQKQCL
ncbi:44980_t:CDS:2, partial [Gigaspora margarita]